MGVVNCLIFLNDSPVQKMLVIGTQKFTCLYFSEVWGYHVTVIQSFASAKSQICGTDKKTPNRNIKTFRVSAFS